MTDDAFRRAAICAIRSRDGWATCDSVGANWQAPDMSLLNKAEPRSPWFPIEALGSAADYVESAARGASAPPDYVAAMLFAAVGAVVGKKCHVRISDDWIEPVSPWCVIVGFPSTGKTPACKPIRRKLRDMEREWAKQHVEHLEHLIAEAEAREASIEEVSVLRAELIGPPRLLVNDTTAEALARVESRASDGLLVERDELAGLIEGLERYGAGGDRAFYLEAYDIGAFTIDRVKAGTLHIDNHCFSIFGGIQPDRFRTLLTHSGDDDGLAARLLVFWPDANRPASIPKGADHGQMIAALDRLDSIRAVSPGQSIQLRLSKDGFDLFNAWYSSKFSQRVGNGDKAGSAYGKLAGMAARVAGCLHLLEFAFGRLDGDSLPVRIDAQIIAAALTLIEDYFVPQIERTYFGTDLSREDAIASAMLNYCRGNGQRAFNMRQVRREWGISGASRKGAAQDFDAACALLVEAGWVRPLETGSRAKDFKVNPALFSN